MFTRILNHGLIAGAIVGVPMFTSMLILGENGPSGALGMAIGYTTMLVAFSMVFLAIKRHRDEVQGGVIKFVPALLIGLGVTLIASLIYVLVWEMTLSVTGIDYGALYAEHMRHAAEQKGASEAELAKITEEAAAFTKMYANRLYRMPITFTEIFPIGLFVSLIAAALLRNPRFMPAKRA